MRSVELFSSQGTLKIGYYAYYYSIMNYGLTLQGKSSHCARSFKIQKNIIGTITGLSKNSTSSITVYTFTSLICGQQ